MKLGILGNICAKLHTEIGTWQAIFDIKINYTRNSLF